MIVIEVPTHSGKYLSANKRQATTDLGNALEFDSLGKAVQYKNEHFTELLSVLISLSQDGYNKRDIAVTELCEECFGQGACNDCYNVGFVKRIVTTVEFVK